MSGASGLPDDQVQEIGVHTYIYAYPLLTMDPARRQVTDIEAGKMPGRRAGEHVFPHPGVPDR